MVKAIGAAVAGQRVSVVVEQGESVAVLKRARLSLLQRRRGGDEELRELYAWPIRSRGVRVGCIVGRLHRTPALWLCNRPQNEMLVQLAAFCRLRGEAQHIMVNRKIALRHVFYREALLEYRAHHAPVATIQT